MFPESWEIVTGRLDLSDSFSDSYISTESRLVDSPNKRSLLVKVIAGGGLRAPALFFTEHRSALLVFVRYGLR